MLLFNTLYVLECKKIAVAFCMEYSWFPTSKTYECFLEIKKILLTKQNELKLAGIVKYVKRQKKINSFSLQIPTNFKSIDSSYKSLIT